VNAPDHWPPGAAHNGPRRAPLFPLPKIFLYPGVVLPLHIFEPRYRELVEDLLDRPGWMVISPIKAGFEDQADGEPPVYPVAGVGEIVKHAKLPDGRFLITLVGLARVRIKEVTSEAAYREVEFEPLEEILPSANEGRRLETELRQAILERSSEFLNLPSNLPLTSLSDLLLQNLDLPVDSMSRAFSEPAVAWRAEFALDEHRARSPEH
jgi:uncharacterized protein